MDNHHKSNGNYRRFFAMIATSSVAMFFLMYLHSYELLAHARFSETRLFMTLIMAGAMMIIMLAFMQRMYKNQAINLAIFVGGALLLLASVGLVRSQVTVDGVDYMEGMIPHHSIAILTSERATIRDVRARKLADDIIKAQQEEIKEMNWLIRDIRENGIAKSQAEANLRPVPKFSSSP